MKRLIIGSALFCCLATPASAAIFVWQGDMFVTGVNNAGSCSAVGVSVGDFARGIFRPRSLAGSTNGANDLLSLVYARSAVQVGASGPLNNATSANVRVIFGSAGFQQFPSNTLSAASVTPTAPTLATPTIVVTLTIHNMFSSNSSTPSGCNATYTGTLAKRP